MLREAAIREGGSWVDPPLAALGEEAGSEAFLEYGETANRHPPELLTFDRHGRRIDEVRFHPAYHALMEAGMRHRIHSVAWTDARPGSHVLHAAMLAVFTEAEAGAMCPVSMTYAAVPVLRRAPELAPVGCRSCSAAATTRPSGRLTDKAGVTIGMAMTEKQGGSDVRANTTRAEPDGAGAWRLLGHKWFCSAPMSDAFLTLAQTEAGLTCFFVPRIAAGRQPQRDPPDAAEGQARQPLQCLGGDRIPRRTGDADRRAGPGRPHDRRDGASHAARHDGRGRSG